MLKSSKGKKTKNKYMKNKFLKIKEFALLLAGFFIFGSCEQGDNPVGANILSSNSIKTEKASIALSATNLAPEPVASGKAVSQVLIEIPGVRGNVQSSISGASVGVYNEPVFGKTQAAFYSQLRLSALNPSFGKNAKVDSVVLVLPVASFNKKDTLSVKEKLVNTAYTLDTADGKCSVKDTAYTFHRSLKFSVDSIYGDKSAKINLQVHLVTENMGTIKDQLMSNKGFATGKLLGEKTIGNTAWVRKTIVSSKKNSKGQGAKEFSSESVPSYRIRLDELSNTFETLFIKQPNNGSDQVTFINNVINGIKISTNSSNGFILNFDPAKAKVLMFYSYDNPNFKDENKNNVDDREEKCNVHSTHKRLAASYEFIMGSETMNDMGYYAVTQSQISNVGAKLDGGKLFLSGMGGNSVRLSLDGVQIEALRKKFNEEHLSITDAVITLSPNFSAQGALPLPNYLYLYNDTQKKVLPDYAVFPFSIVSEKYNQKDKVYVLHITQFLKNIVEKGEPKDDLRLMLGNYPNSGQLFFTPSAYNASNSIYNPYRLILDQSNLKIEVSYTNP
ncbi:DUF4270 family protein [Ornithobacterium rhinotracheale]|nr:DUF4270 family protein [Ornithobacterium rhinotracheale]